MPNALRRGYCTSVALTILALFKVLAHDLFCDDVRELFYTNDNRNAAREEICWDNAAVAC